MRRLKRTTEDISYSRVFLVPMLRLETNNKANNKRLPKCVNMDNASSGIKRAIASKQHKNELRFSSVKGDEESTIYFQFDE